MGLQISLLRYFFVGSSDEDLDLDFEHCCGVMEPTDVSGDMACE